MATPAAPSLASAPPDRPLGEAPLAALLPPRGETLSPDAILDRFVAWVAAPGLSLYPHQEEAILQLLDGRHVVLSTPTGSGKSLVAARWGLPVTRFKSGPLGGDQQVGAKIAGGEIDVLIFFWDPLEPHPHEPDVRALLRVAVLYNIPIACNRGTADFIVASPLVHGEYTRLLTDHGASREAFVRSKVG